METVRLDVMRFTVVDPKGTVSFVAHSSVAVALTAACSHDPATLDDLLAASERYDKALRSMVVNGLAVFDEHNLPGEASAIHEQLTSLPERDVPPFRVLDEVTREASLRAVREGVILYNLVRKRIVQMVNTYEPLSRSGEVNYHNGKFLSRKLLDYELPTTWSIVP